MNIPFVKSVFPVVSFINNIQLFILIQDNNAELIYTLNPVHNISINKKLIQIYHIKIDIIQDNIYPLFKERRNMECLQKNFMKFLNMKE